MYSKIIISGNTVETYEYQKSIPYTHQTGTASHKGRKRDTSNVDLDDRSSVLVAKARRQDHAKRAQMDFKRLVRANLGESDHPVLVTLTYRENAVEVSKCYKDFTAFNQRLRAAYKTEFKYVSVVEFQRRGAVHFHALYWRLPAYVVYRERQIRNLAYLWGHGFVYLKQTDSSYKIANYLAKYMVKAFTNPLLFNQKAYVASRNIKRPTRIGSEFPISALLTAYEIDQEPQFKRAFHSPLLGDATYCYYQLSIPN